MKYDFDVAKLKKQYLPIVLRMPKLLAFVSVLGVSLQKLKESFLSFVESSKNEISRNGQVFSLLWLLNDLFDAELRRINIVDTQLKTFILSDAVPTIFSDSEPIIVIDATDFDETVDFTVRVPLVFDSKYFTILSDEVPTILSDEVPTIFYDQADINTVAQIAGIVKKYSIAGKRFTIQTV